MSGRGVTFEDDRAHIYRKRRMPRRKRRRWVRKVKLNRVLDLKAAGSQTQVFNNRFSNSNNTNGIQGVIDFALYSATNLTRTELDDLRTLAVRENATPSAGIAIAPTTKIYFQSAVLDMTIQNTSFKNDATTEFAGTLELDIYEVVSKSKWAEYDSSSALTQYGSWSDICVEGMSETSGINNLNKLAYNQRGATPGS